jgi:hypothetical protein
LADFQLLEAAKIRTMYIHFICISWIKQALKALLLEDVYTIGNNSGFVLLRILGVFNPRAQPMQCLNQLVSSGLENCLNFL